MNDAWQRIAERPPCRRQHPPTCAPWETTCGMAHASPLLDSCLTFSRHLLPYQGAHSQELARLDELYQPIRSSKELQMADRSDDADVYPDGRS